MIRLWATTISIDDIDTGLRTISLDLEALRKSIGPNQDATIYYKDLDEKDVVDCITYDEPFDWNCWEGTCYVGHTWKNLKTGEFNPEADWDFGEKEDFYDNWEDGSIYRRYEEGKLIEEWFV